MGFFSALRDAVVEVNETTHGERLKKGLASTLSCMGALDESLQSVAVAKFLETRDMLNQQRPNWSRAGRIKMGRGLQEEARKRFDFNQAESFGLWLAGAWIESGERQSAEAEYVHLFLEELVRQGIPTVPTLIHYQPP